MSSRAVLIGLDGLGWDVLESALESGEFPTIARLREDGVAADLESTHPPWTPCAWPSLQSGRNPGSHGVFDFFTREGYQKQLIDRQDVDAPYLPDVADAENKTVISINFPVTHPVPEYENGAVVPGYLAPENVEFYPSKIREIYKSRYGEYTLYPEYDAEDKAVEQYIDVARGRKNMATLLDDRYDWDLLAVQFQVTDSIFHDLEDQADRDKVLSAIDGFVDEIVSLGDDPNVFVASDHGMGTYHWTFYINSWLANNGYAETTQGELSYFRNKKADLKGKDGDSSTLGTILETGMATSSKVGLTPQRIHSALSTVGLAKHVERILPEEALVSAQNRTVDWKHSEAFQIFFNSLGVHLNRAGREPGGTVDEERYERLRDELIEELGAVTDPDGENVFEEIKRKEAVYSGDHLDDAPDLLLYPRDYDYDVSGSIMGPFRPYEHQNHKPNGILIAAGSDVEAASIERASIFDVAPTVAAALGIPVDSHRDGSVLPVVDEPVTEQSWEALTEVSYGDATEDDSDVEERLANLGYME